LPTDHGSESRLLKSEQDINHLHSQILNLKNEVQIKNQYINNITIKVEGLAGGIANVLTRNECLTTEKLEWSNKVFQQMNERRRLEHDHNQQLVVSKLNYQALQQQHLSVINSLQQQISEKDTENNKLVQEQIELKTSCDTNQVKVDHLQSQLVNTQQRVDRINSGQEEMNKKLVQQMKQVEVVMRENRSLQQSG
jgi:chromosome segregation ATPase